MPATYPRLINTHDYMSLDLGNGRRLTVSYGGQKATGAIPHEVFDFWCRAHSFEADAMAALGLERVGATHGSVIAAFMAKMDLIWPSWNIPPKVPAIGEMVTIDFGKRKGKETGKVEAVRGTSITARFPTQGLVRFSADLIKS